MTGRDWGLLGAGLVGGGVVVGLIVAAVGLGPRPDSGVPTEVQPVGGAGGVLQWNAPVAYSPDDASNPTPAPPEFKVNAHLLQGEIEAFEALRGDAFHAIEEATIELDSKTRGKITLSIKRDSGKFSWSVPSANIKLAPCNDKTSCKGSGIPSIFNTEATLSATFSDDVAGGLKPTNQLRLVAKQPQP